jgi:CO/xanthine dehydrogenase Mo-binding subunit
LHLPVAAFCHLERNAIHKGTACIGAGNRITPAPVEQSNFPDYEPLRITDMPEIDVVIVSSAEAPSGVGEPSVPPTGPAVANAIFALTGKRITELPT